VVNGSNVYVNKQYVVVVPAGEAAPDFIASIESGAAPLTVDFTNLSLNATLSSWYFSDDESSTGWVDSSSPDWNPTHVFNTAGTFEVYLSVTNDTGASHLQVLIITVN
jgi:PKD repeat protein